MPKDTAEKAPFHHGALREALLDAGLQVIAEKGVQEFSLRDIARSVGVSHTAPYRHFANKEELLAALGVRGFTLFRDRLREGWAARFEGENYFERFLRMGWAYLQFARDESALFRLMFAEVISDPQIYESLLLVSGESFGVLQDAVSEGFERELIHGPSPLEVALQIWAGVHGLSHLWIEGRFSALCSYGLDEHEFLDRSIRDLIEHRRQR